jgi:iron(III) transport system permease protein
MPVNQPVDKTFTKQSRAMNKVSSLSVASTIIAVIFCLPILVIISYLFAGAGPSWSHLVNTVLTGYISNSLLLMFGVGIGVLVLGLPAAWVTSICEFPGRKFFSWAVLLPLAMPAYIIAYTYTGLLDFAGPIQTSFRELTGLKYGEYWFPPIRSLTGAMLMLSLVLYPYIYMLARAAFIEQSICVLEASRSLGCTSFSAFYRVALPLARPAIITGLSLALMETLADYGTVAYFGISTFTTGIFRTWFGFGDEQSAVQLAAILLGFVILLVLMERRSRRKSRFHHTSNRYSTISRYQLQGYKKWAAVLCCALPLLFGFAIPVGQLLYWSLTQAAALDGSFIRLVWHSFYLGFAAAVLAVLLALIVSYAQRSSKSRWVQFSTGLTSMGYAMPGTIIAVGVLIPFAWFDHQLIAIAKSALDLDMGLLFSGTVVAMLFAYLVRFLSISINTVNSGLAKIKPSMDDAARSMGESRWGVLRKVHLPVMKSTVFTALLLVFVDVLKELPATIILRPFNFNTLAVRAHEMAGDERLVDAGPPALMIVLVGLIPVILLSRVISKSRAGQQKSDL